MWYIVCSVEVYSIIVWAVYRYKYISEKRQKIRFAIYAIFFKLVLTIRIGRFENRDTCAEAYLACIKKYVCDIRDIILYKNIQK